MAAIGLCKDTCQLSYGILILAAVNHRNNCIEPIEQGILIIGVVKCRWGERGDNAPYYLGQLSWGVLLKDRHYHVIC